MLSDHLFTIHMQKHVQLYQNYCMFFKNRQRTARIEFTTIENTFCTLAFGVRLSESLIGGKRSRVMAVMNSGHEATTCIS